MLAGALDGDPAATGGVEDLGDGVATGTVGHVDLGDGKTRDERLEHGLAAVHGQMASAG